MPQIEMTERPIEEQVEYVVQVRHYWGRGATYEEARKQCRLEGGKFHEGHGVLRFGPGVKFEGVSRVDGSVSYSSADVDTIKPTYTWVARGKKYLGA